MCYLAVFPQPCMHNCMCHRSPWDRANIFDCRNQSLTSLPETVLEDTDWLLLSGNNLRSLNKAPKYLNNITLLDLSSSSITEIGDRVMGFTAKSVKHLDIRKNQLKTLPRTISNVNGSSKFWISDNPYECNCDMTWMKNWLMDTINIQDKDDVICSSGKMNGREKLSCKASN